MEYLTYLFILTFKDNWGSQRDVNTLAQRVSEHEAWGAYYNLLWISLRQPTGWQLQHTMNCKTISYHKRKLRSATTKQLLTVLCTFAGVRQRSASFLRDWCAWIIMMVAIDRHIMIIDNYFSMNQDEVMSSSDAASSRNFSCLLIADQSCSSKS